MGAIKLPGAFVNLLTQFPPPLVPLADDLACVQAFGLLGLFLGLVGAQFADGSGADCTAEPNGVVVLVLAWHRVCCY